MTSMRLDEKIAKRWEVRDVLSGGCGVVYIAFDHSFKRSLAIKTFNDATGSAIDQSAFLREAATWIRLDHHPNVVQAFFVLHLSGRPHLFLDYESGGNLRQWMASVSNRERYQEGLRLAIELCDGLSHIYGRGIAAHRDLKPENCLLSSDGHLKVTDFGLASLQASHASTADGDFRTLPGGTPAYMPPEQFHFNSLNMSADVYSFGIVLHELLTGGHPFARWMSTADDPWQWAHLHQKIEPDIDCSRLPLPVQMLLRRCLAKDFRDRYQSFAPIRESLAHQYRTTTKKTVPVPQNMPLNSTELELKAVGFFELNLPDEAAECLAGVLDLDEDQDELYLSHDRIVALLHLCEFDKPGWQRGVGVALICALAPGRTFIKGSPPELSGALEVLETLIKKAPRRSSVLEMKARLLLIAGQYESALKALREAISSRPGAEKWKAKLIGLPFYHSRIWTQELPRQSDSDSNIAECVRISAELGDPNAQFYFGLACLKGRGVRLSPVQAFVWLFLATRNGHPESLAELERVYSFLQKNENFQLDEKCPSALSQAKHNIGAAFYFGSGTPQDYVAAAQWFREAAEMGLSDSRYNLGIMYVDGQGVEKNLPFAYYWLHLAAAQGNEQALAARRSVESEMSPAELTEASDLISRRAT